VYCDHCQTTAVEGAKFCSSCGGKLSDGRADATDLGSAPTVALTVGPCESCGAPSLPGSTLCLPCTRAFESILGTQPATAVETAPMPAVAEMATLLVPQASALPSAPGAPPVLADAQPPAVSADDEDEYEDVDDEDADDLLAEEAATVLMAAPVAPMPPPVAADAAPPVAVASTPEPPPTMPELDAADWSTPSTTPDDHEAIEPILPWARKGSDATDQPAVVADAEPAPEPTPWWERNGSQSPAGAARPETSRYVPASAAAPPTSASLESTVARQAMRPKASSLPPVVTARHSGSRSRTMAIAAAIAGVAAIGTPVAWKLAFASRPTLVSMPRTAAPAQPAETPVAAPTARASRPERTHGLPPAEPPRVYHDLQPTEPVAAVTIGKNGIPIASAAVRSSVHTPAPPRPAPTTKKPAAAATRAPAPTPTAPPPAAPTPLPVSSSPVAAVAALPAPAPTPAQVSPEAVPLGQIFEVSQVDMRPAVTSQFDPVLPARLAGQRQVVLIVRVLVAPSGRAAEATTVKNPTGDAGVSAAAVATVRQWKFTPATRKGLRVSCWYNVGVVFRPASGN
jgi:TonB family protein